MLAELSLFRIDLWMVRSAVYRDVRVWWALAVELNWRLYETWAQTAIDAVGSVRRWVAAHLLDLASAQQRAGGHLVAGVLQQELADAVGSVREVVARVLREFGVEWLVATSPESIQVLDLAGLHDQFWNPGAP